MGRRGQRADGARCALIQGFCLGGELPGALTYVVETAPRIAPFVCGVVFACVTMGVAVATGVSLSVRTFLDPALVPAYGWRIAFVLGGLGGVLSFVLRRSLEESPEFERMSSLASRQPFTRTAAHALRAGADRLRAARRHRLLQRPVLLAPAGVPVGVLKYDPRQAVLSQTVGVIASALGILADGLDRRSHSAALSAARRCRRCCCVLAFPFYSALETRAMNLTLLCVLAGLQRGPDQRLVRGAADRSLPDPHPLHRRGARLQRQLHALQRHGAARRDDVDSRYRPGGLAGLHDDGERRARARRQPLGGTFGGNVLARRRAQ